jgi:DNA-directed RNA polymerase subunit M/transcription elongation factor TFIIS
LAIQVNCPSCGKLLRLPDDVSGKQLQCPGCHNQFKMQAQNGPTKSSRMVQSRGRIEAEIRRSRPSSRVEEFDDDEFDDRPVRRRSARRYDDGGFACPFCGSHDSPYTRSKISTAGWIIFAILLLVFWPLFWIGLLIKENYRVCADCGKTLS